MIVTKNYIFFMNILFICSMRAMEAENDHFIPIFNALKNNALKNAVINDTSKDSDFNLNDSTSINNLSGGDITHILDFLQAADGKTIQNIESQGQECSLEGLMDIFVSKVQDNELKRYILQTKNIVAVVKKLNEIETKIGQAEYFLKISVMVIPGIFILMRLFGMCD